MGAPRIRAGPVSRGSPCGTGTWPHRSPGRRVLNLLLGLRKGEALGLIWPDDNDDWPSADEDNAEIALEWQLLRVGGKPLTHKQILRCLKRYIAREAYPLLAGC